MNEKTVSVEIPGFMVMAISHRLPCGCALNIMTKVEQPEGSMESDWVDHSAGILKYWVDNRKQVHTCELVSGDNPAGKDPAKVEALRSSMSS